MSDIIISSGGESSNFVVPLSQGPKVIVVSCEEDLGMCVEAGQPVHSAELILGGVLRQELDLSSYPYFYYCLCSVSLCSLPVLNISLTVLFSIIIIIVSYVYTSCCFCFNVDFDDCTLT